jgi:hypothetical protein
MPVPINTTPNQPHAPICPVKVKNNNKHPANTRTKRSAPPTLTFITISLWFRNSLRQISRFYQSLQSDGELIQWFSFIDWVFRPSFSVAKYSGLDYSAFSIHRHMRTRSSVGLERHTTDVEVIGSNPFGSAIKFIKTKKPRRAQANRGFFVFTIFDCVPERVRMEKAAANEHRSVRGKARRKRDLAFSGPAVRSAWTRDKRKANPFVFIREAEGEWVQI